VNGYCNLTEVELAFIAAVDFGGAVGTRVFLRCTDLTLPSEKKKKKSEAPISDGENTWTHG